MSGYKHFIFSPNAALSGIRQDDVLPPLPPERRTEQAGQRSVSIIFISLKSSYSSVMKHFLKLITVNVTFFSLLCSEEAEEYKRKLIQVRKV